MQDILRLLPFTYDTSTMVATTTTAGFLGLAFFKIRHIKSLSHSLAHAILLALFCSSRYIFCHTLAKHREPVSLLVSKPHNKMMHTKSPYTHWLSFSFHSHCPGAILVPALLSLFSSRLVFYHKQNQ